MFNCSNVQMFKCSNIQMFKCSNVQMSKIKCQMSIRLNFCRGVPPEFLRSFLPQLCCEARTQSFIFTRYGTFWSPWGFIRPICPGKLLQMVPTPIPLKRMWHRVKSSGTPYEGWRPPVSPFLKQENGTLSSSHNVEKN